MLPSTMLAQNSAVDIHHAVFGNEILKRLPGMPRNQEQHDQYPQPLYRIAFISDARR